MNERIKQRAEQAGMYIVDDKFSTYGKFAEKFAELIVRECAEVGSYGAGPTDTDLIKRSVLQHFGVEE